ncbi:hypothetical protein [Teichococcus oryzae]|uniref:Uncharacterized protein n=1 Tax=Teichococcus oryzae TaxID=1608942 RepID=A0A5B2TGH4_9PROT|nr:hypothetical protein [Pseudoroseomonas oryzae]KAA2213601.1 hypothetical protein F0Q34_10255 [Pseudoroseomonas oryzae]
MAVATLLSACALGPAPLNEEPKSKRGSVVRPQKPSRNLSPAGPDQGAAPSRDANTAKLEEGVATGAGMITSSPTQVYRVKADGTIGCEKPASLHILRGLRETGAASPRLLAQAHRDGRCMTIFRVNEWSLVSEQEEVAKLRLRHGSGQPISLYFFRSEITP